MKKLILGWIFAITLCGAAEAQVLEAAEKSVAFKQYLIRPHTELSKLIYLLDRFNVPGVEMRVDGNVYSADKAFPYSKSYLAQNYKKEKAEVWIRAHCYRSRERNEIIYMRLDKENFKPARDILIEELSRLRAPGK